MTTAERIIKHRAYWSLVLLLWSGIVALSIHWNITALEEHAFMMGRERGKNLFKAVILTRKWNAEHGPIYAPVTEKTPPNPYLDLPHRDFTTPFGQEMTAVNPAYMTRQLSEMAKEEGTYFHLTSLRPIRPANSADDWEREALESFQKGEKERTAIIKTAEKRLFRYMAPLKVEPLCLPCHARQGYKVGDIRGGLSVNIDAEKVFRSLEEQERFIYAVHAIAWVVVSLLLLTFLNATRRHTLMLEGIGSARQKDIKHHRAQVEEDSRELHDLITRDTVTGVHTAEHFRQLSSVLWNNALSNRSEVSLFLLEVDAFSDYCDNYGALEGDILLKQVASAITRIVTDKGTIIARYGNASFAIMMVGQDANEALDLALKIQGAVNGLDIPHETSENSRLVTITGTVTTTRPQHGDSLAEFVRTIRRCLTEGARKGRNHIYRC